MYRTGANVAILIVQTVSAALFIVNIGFSIFGVAPLAWVVNELTEIGAAVGLVLGTVLGGIALRRSLRRTQEAEAKLRAASGAFMELLEERFRAWALTPAERDVALFAIKGMSTPEIAQLRQTSEGTDGGDLPQGGGDRAPAAPVSVHRRLDGRPARLKPCGRDTDRAASVASVARCRVRSLPSRTRLISHRMAVWEVSKPAGRRCSGSMSAPVPL